MGFLGGKTPWGCLLLFLLGGGGLGKGLLVNAKLTASSGAGKTPGESLLLGGPPWEGAPDTKLIASSGIERGKTPGESLFLGAPLGKGLLILNLLLHQELERENPRGFARGKNPAKNLLLHQAEGYR